MRLFVVVVLMCAASSSTAVETRSLYDVLGVTKDAGEDEIRRAYRKMSLIYHPGALLPPSCLQSAPALPLDCLSN